MRLTARDKAVIKAANDYRILRQEQIQRLFFPSKNTAQVRLQLLWQHGYLKRYFFLVMNGYFHSPTLYTIDAKGVELLQREYGYTSDELRIIRNEPSQNFLYHTVGLSEIRLQLTQSSQRQHFKVAEWIDEKAHKADFDRMQVGQQLLPIVPDGYCRLTTPEHKALHFFVEYDRGTEGLRFFKQKLSAYAMYLRSNLCLKRYGTTAIRVLTIVEGETTSRRIVSLQKVAEAVGGGRWFYFSSLEDITTGDILADPMWRRLGDETLSSLL